MPQLAQHSAAELWELSRDHYVCAAKLEMVLPQVQDQQLKSTLAKHCQEFRQIAQRLDQFLGVQQGIMGVTPGPSFGTPTFGTGAGGGAMGTAGGVLGGNAGWGQGYTGGITSSVAAPTSYSPIQHQPMTGAHPNDVILVGTCLRDCKSLAVQCVHAATELSQPARNYVYEIAGYHLRLAEEHYNWLKQRQLYASPKVNPQDIQEYGRALQTISSIGEQVAANSRSVQAPYGVGMNPTQFTGSVASGQQGIHHAQYPRAGQHSQHQHHGQHGQQHGHQHQSGGSPATGQGSHRAGFAPRI